jgi:hypothetical protein
LSISSHVKFHCAVLFYSLKQLAAHYLSEKRSVLELAISMSETPNEVDSVADSVVPSAYVGQFARLLEEGDNADMQP